MISKCHPYGHACQSYSKTVSALQSRQISFWKKGKDKKDEDLEANKQVLEVQPTTTSKPSIWSHLTPEQIMKIRDKSRLPHDVMCELKGIPEHGKRLTHIDHYRRDYIRPYFAKYGKASGIKPGVCWPSKEELEFKLKFEETFYPDLQKLVKDEKAIQDEKAKEQKEYRKTVLSNLKKLPQAKKEFWDKFNAKKELEEEEKRKRDRVIQEVREYLGYDVSPGDTRFQEALTKKQEEELVVAKASRKQEKQAKILAALSAMAEEQIKKAEEASAAAIKEKDKKEE